jgi:hypothetical protein
MLGTMAKREILNETIKEFIERNFQIVMIYNFQYSSEIFHYSTVSLAMKLEKKQVSF